MEILQYIVYYGDAFSKRWNQTFNFGLEKKGGINFSRNSTREPTYSLLLTFNKTFLTSGGKANQDGQDRLTIGVALHC